MVVARESPLHVVSGHTFETPVRGALRQGIQRRSLCAVGVPNPIAGGGLQSRNISQLGDSEGVDTKASRNTQKP